MIEYKKYEKNNISILEIKMLILICYSLNNLLNLYHIQ